MHTGAAFLLVVASVSAARVQSVPENPGDIQPVPENDTLSVLSTDFVCPSEYCYECCGPDEGSYGSHFKCVLRDPNKFPEGRECWEESKQRSDEPTQFKTECRVLVGELNPPEKKCWTKSAFRKFVKWAWDKRGEVFGGLAKKTVVEMGMIIKLIHKRVDQKRAKRVSRLVPLSELVPIHPVDVMNAIQATAKRARAAVAARQLLEGATEAPDHYPVLTQEMILGEPSLKAFRSINPFYVVNLGPEEGFVTFEGNGRSVALRWAFRDQRFRENLKVEVEEFVFETEEDRQEIVDRIKKLREDMGSAEFDAMEPPELDDESIKEWGEALPRRLEHLMMAARAEREGWTVPYLAGGSVPYFEVPPEPARKREGRGTPTKRERERERQRSRDRKQEHERRWHAGEEME